MRYRVIEFTPILLLVAVLVVVQARAPRLEQATSQPSVTATPAPVPTPDRRPAFRPLVGHAATVAASGCDARRPEFSGGIATLSDRLGAGMGEATECEHPVSADGDTQQRTTRGLAYYRHARNISAFTTGYEHWALAGRDLVHWSGPDVDPPAEAITLP